MKLCSYRVGPVRDCVHDIRATWVGTTSSREADPDMHRLLAAGLTVVAAAALAVAAAFGVVALLNATPDQPNTPLVHYETAPRGQ
ncbi:hypothetical protein GCM10010449_28580 [Streptomyces rectiviolaceus]|uniref:Uncharacterized protein n=2 Tax=Streptomyces TaxID=1883 RepID=A0ABP6MGJ7_9ACTN